MHEGHRISPYSTNPDALEKALQKNDAVAQRLREALLARMGDVPVFMRELKQRFSIWHNHQNGNRDCFPESRKARFASMKGTEWGGLQVVRDLKVNVFG